MQKVIQDCIEIFYQKGITQFVVCPGSRSAPLTLALARHPQIQTLVVPDERSAGYTALGMALQSKQTVGLVCTSGTAVLNFAPAVAEAFFQEIPLLILTADRPAEWIGQQDGQTIFQREVYGKHVKMAYEFPVDYTHPDATWHAHRVANEAANLALRFPCGPVHINIPLREPLYPKPDERFIRNPALRLIREYMPAPTLSPEDWHQIQNIWEDAEKKLIVVGQQFRNTAILPLLKHLQEEWEIAIIGDIISNIHDLPETIRHQDLILMQKDESLLFKLQPDLLVTFGKSVISKNLKLFLRNHPPRYHFHLQPAGTAADTFQTLTHLIPLEPVHFLQRLSDDLDFIRYQSGDESDLITDYHEYWQAQDRQIRFRLEKSLQNQAFNEFEAVKLCLEQLPTVCVLHLANSMAVRYANFLSLPPTLSVSDNGIEVCANRGTSGIDGSTSTAVGFARQTDKLVVLLTGDVAFFYDRNALWQPDLPANLRIILLNNHGGGIFRMIDAGNQPEVDTFFETPHTLTAQQTALDFGFDYTFCQQMIDLQAALPGFFSASQSPKILEIETNTRTNTEVYQKVRLAMTQP